MSNKFTWWCCGHTRKASFCPVCGSKKWNTGDIKAAESLSELLTERERHKSTIETYDAKIKDLKNHDKSYYIKESRIKSSLENEPGGMFAGAEMNDPVIKEGVIHRIFEMKLSRAEGQKEYHKRSYNKFKKWSDSLSRNLLK